MFFFFCFAWMYISELLNLPSGPIRSQQQDIVVRQNFQVVYFSKRKTIDGSFHLTKLRLQLILALTRFQELYLQNRLQDLSRSSYLTFPDATMMWRSWGIEGPLDPLITDKTSQLTLDNFFKGKLQLCIGANKIVHVIWKKLFDGTSSGHKSPYSTDAGTTIFDKN